MIENEVSILRRVKHINIISLVEEFDTHDELYLVMELVRVRNILNINKKKCRNQIIVMYRDYAYP